MLLLPKAASPLLSADAGEQGYEEICERSNIQHHIVRVPKQQPIQVAQQIYKHVSCLHPHRYGRLYIMHIHEFSPYILPIWYLLVILPNWILIVMHKINSWHYPSLSEGSMSRCKHDYIYICACAEALKCIININTLMISGDATIAHWY